MLPRAALVLTIPLALLSCARDPADQEYLAALRGEETGMTRDEQIAHIGRAIAITPGRAWYHETRAIYEIDTRRFAAAEADVDTSIQLADRPYLRFLRGLVACQRGEFERSLPDFDRAIAGQPKNSQFYRGRSLARSRVGRFREALADAEQLAMMAPQQGETYYALRMAYAGLGRLREAVQSFDESLRRRPELIYPRLARADAYERLGDTLRASADRDEARRREQSSYALSLDPFRY